MSSISARNISTSLRRCEGHITMLAVVCPSHDDVVECSLAVYSQTSAQSGGKFALRTDSEAISDSLDALRAEGALCIDVCDLCCTSRHVRLGM